MKIYLGFLLISMVIKHVVLETCLTYEDCINDDVKKAGALYRKRASELMRKSKTMAIEAEGNLRKAVYGVNEEIIKGPEECRNFILPRSPGYYSRKLAQNCVYNSTQDVTQRKSMIKMREKNLERAEKGSQREKEVFCETFVPIANLMCQPFQDKIKEIEECDKIDLFAKFENVKGWFDCAKEKDKDKRKGFFDFGVDEFLRNLIAFKININPFRPGAFLPAV